MKKKLILLTFFSFNIQHSLDAIPLFPKNPSRDLFYRVKTFDRSPETNSFLIRQALRQGANPDAVFLHTELSQINNVWVWRKQPDSAVSLATKQENIFLLTLFLENWQTKFKYR